MSSIGINIGNQTCKVGAYLKQSVQILQNDEGNNYTYAYVQFNDKQVLIGDSAMDAFALNPQNTIFNINSLFNFKANSEDYEDSTKQFLFKVFKNDENQQRIKINLKHSSKNYSFDDIYQILIYKMKSLADKYLETRIKNVVIAIPLSFNEFKVNMMKKSAIKAGFKNIRFISEPIAACQAYQLTNGNICVLDFGATKFNSTIVRGDEGIFQILGVNEVPIGGNDIDELIFNQIAEKFQLQHNKDIKQSLQSVLRLKRLCQLAKHNLSTMQTTQIDEDSIFDGINLCQSVYQSQLEDISINLFNQVIQSINSALVSAQLTKNQIQYVVIAGGSCRIPKFQQLVKDYFQMNIMNTINPEEVISHGATLQAKKLFSIPVDEQDLVKSQQAENIDNLSSCCSKCCLLFLITALLGLLSIVVILLKQ
ncbi:Cytosolic_heat shock protein 70 [Hexamita inflata]|uniref:Cytosolic_heat shock protein 70 n=1 Tax=Hexamita inflata TaxID=28002 RepID=A0ABP1HWN4_9EUKA